MQSPPRNQDRKRKASEPNRETLAAYSTHADQYLEHWSRGRSYRVPPLLEEWAEPLPKGALILDLGCGPGQDSRYLRIEGFRPIGLDATWPFLLHARRRTRRLSLVLAELDRLPFESNAFDAVWAAASLIHVPKRKLHRVLVALRGITRSGGRVGATFAHGKGEGFLAEGWIPGRYFSYWKKNELAEGLARAGWKVLSLKTVCNRERKGRWLNLIAVKG
jgi:SAM-dependent methyltransferase